MLTGELLLYPVFSGVSGDFNKNQSYELSASFLSGIATTTARSTNDHSRPNDWRRSRPWQ
ncbi:hypothetical protein LC1Hm_1555 [Halomicrobium sp. LC1Hm]|nr:hypothetical protein LC1Hm_1555 [Halomicrobium sp. LC1Hm]